MIRLTDYRQTPDILRYLRRDRGLSQDALARKLFCTRTAVSYRETGERDFHIGALIDTLDALGYDVVLVPRAGALIPDRRTA